MNLGKSIGKFFITALFAVSILPISVQAQDLLARQAPIDRKMKAVDTLVLKSIVEREQEQSPAASLYHDWDNRYAHRRIEMPDTFTSVCLPIAVSLRAILAADGADNTKDLTSKCTSGTPFVQPLVARFAS